MRIEACKYGHLNRLSSIDTESIGFLNSFGPWLMRLNKNSSY
jgi:hypothetical protein